MTPLHDSFLTGYYNFKAAILRDRPMGDMFLSLEANEAWQLYQGPSEKEINMQTPVLSGEGGGVFALNINGPVRHYFKLVTKTGAYILSEARLPLEGGFNFRDMGGLPAGGSYVKWGKVLRGDELNRLTQNDLNYLSLIPLISVADFRAQSERENSPDKNPQSLKANYSLAIDPGNLSQELKTLNDLGSEAMEIYMKNIYVSLASQPAFIGRYREFFELLQNENEVPLLFHCSAGKDRTGMGGALFLYSLGASDETVMKDYMLSNIFLEKKYAAVKRKHPSIRALFEVKPEFILSGLHLLKHKYGSIENYLEKELGVNLALMRKMYLY